MQVLQEGKKYIKLWTDGVEIEEEAIEQLRNVCRLPFIQFGVVGMPDMHWGNGSCIGSVIPLRGAIAPSLGGVDLGCGMRARKTVLSLLDIEDILPEIRAEIERLVPTARTNNGGAGDRGAWNDIPDHVRQVWRRELLDVFGYITGCHEEARPMNSVNHLGTLGGGNHFIEICVDESERIWILLHSGSRGPGNKFGSFYIKKAAEMCRKWFIKLPDKNLGYFPEGLDLFDEYLIATEWAQKFAYLNRTIMLNAVSKALDNVLGMGEAVLEEDDEGIDCHHNYVARENHFKANLLVVRKGAIRAREGDMGIIPGSMGAKSYIVRGLGNPESFMSCSHGAGRVMSRTAAKKVEGGLEKLQAMTAGVECRKDETVLDEAPYAYKDIEAVMAAQRDLVEVVHTLKQVVCVKGVSESKKRGKK